MTLSPAFASPLLLPVQPLRRIGEGFSVRSIDLDAAAASGLPVLGLDHFQVRQHSFGPHPHAGFSAVTYVLPDSPGGLRSRDSLGGDVVVGPGGIVWLQAGSGALHEELQANPGLTLQGLQVFVNLPASHKLIAPRVLHLDGPDVPEWRSPSGDGVRVVVGSFGDLASPLQPTPSIRWLDVDLRTALDVALPPGEVLLAYLMSGQVRLRSAAHEMALIAGQAVALAGSGTPLAWQADGPARMVLLSGPALHEPVVRNGPFVMNSAGQLSEAMHRYQSGRMGALAPARET